MFYPIQIANSTHLNFENQMEDLCFLKNKTLKINYDLKGVYKKMQESELYESAIEKAPSWRDVFDGEVIENVF